MKKHFNHGYLSPLRYPGGKSALSNFIKLILVQNALLDGEYVEVYAGGASIAWALLFEEYVKCVHVNDLDFTLIAFWKSILSNTEKFCQKIYDTKVTIEEWYQQRIIQEKPHDFSMFEVGFSTFFLNRTNRSGILKGGVIGGKYQTGKWKIDARFNKDDLIKRIRRIACYSNRIYIYNLDAADFIKMILPKLSKKTLVYLDPPYFHKGKGLYENHYKKEDHEKIALLISNAIQQPWIVSYDTTNEIMQLYKNFLNIQYSLNYSAQTRRSGSEVIFFHNSLKVPPIQNPTSIQL